MAVCVRELSGQPAGFRSQWLSPNRGQSAQEIRNLTAAGRCPSSTAHGGAMREAVADREAWRSLTCFTRV